MEDGGWRKEEGGWWVEDDGLRMVSQARGLSQVSTLLRQGHGEGRLEMMYLFPGYKIKWIPEYEIVFSFVKLGSTTIGIYFVFQLTIWILNPLKVDIFSES